MAIGLLGSSIVVSTLVPPEDITTVNAAGEPPLDADGKVVEKIDRIKPPANARALAYIAHGEGSTKEICPLFGMVFGTIYDISTILILWFAGASAMAALLNLVPRYLPRYGMAPEWARATRPLVIVFTAVAFLVTIIFEADVDAQGGAYATGVLVLMSSAAIAVTLSVWRTGWQQWAFLAIALVFFYTTVANVIERPEGLHIASLFIGAIVLTSFLSRLLRATELRVEKIEIDATATLGQGGACRRIDDGRGNCAVNRHQISHGFVYISHL